MSDDLSEWLVDNLSRLDGKANALIFALDEDGRVILWNREIAVALGFTREEALGRSLIDTFVASEFHQELRTVFLQVKKGTNAVGLEFPLVTISGETHAVVFSILARLNATGQVVGVVGVGQRAAGAYGITLRAKSKDREQKLLHNQVVEGDMSSNNDAPGDPMVSNETEQACLVELSTSTVALLRALTRRGVPLDSVEGDSLIIMAPELSRASELCALAEALARDVTQTTERRDASRRPPSSSIDEAKIANGSHDNQLCVVRLMQQLFSELSDHESRIVSKASSTTMDHSLSQQEILQRALEETLHFFEERRVSCRESHLRLEADDEANRSLHCGDFCGQTWESFKGRREELFRAGSEHVAQASEAMVNEAVQIAAEIVRHFQEVHIGDCEAQEMKTFLRQGLDGRDLQELAESRAEQLVRIARQKSSEVVAASKDVVDRMRLTLQNADARLSKSLVESHAFHSWELARREVEEGRQELLRHVRESAAELGQRREEAKHRIDEMKFELCRSLGTEVWEVVLDTREISQDNHHHIQESRDWASFEQSVHDGCDHIQACMSETLGDLDKQLESIRGEIMAKAREAWDKINRDFSDRQERMRMKYSVLYATSVAPSPHCRSLPNLADFAKDQVVELVQESVRCRGSFHQTSLLAQELARDTLRSLASQAQRQIQVLEMVRRDAHANQSQEILGFVNHELRTPLQAICSYVGLSQETISRVSTASDPKSSIPPDQLQLFNEALSEVNRNFANIDEISDLMLNILNNVLDIRKLEEKRMDFELHWVAANSFVIGAVNVLMAKILRKKSEGKIRFEFHMENDNLYVRAEPYRIRQVLVNILGNALKFTREGVIAVRVELIEMAWLRFSVRDTGCGISPIEQELLFEPFQRLVNGNDTRKAQGTGLGLYFCKLIVQAMGGRIWLEVEENYGTVFHFEVPTKCEFRSASSKDDLRQEKTSSSRRAGRDLNGVSFPFQFLVVDDFYPCRAPLVSFLKSKCNAKKVLEAGNGEEAVRCVQDCGGEIDLIFMDKQMPVMGGVKATQMLRSKGYKMPIIGITGDIGPKDRNEFSAAGATQVLAKPVKLKDLRQLLSDTFYDARTIGSVDLASPRSILPETGCSCINAGTETMAEHSLAKDDKLQLSLKACGLSSQVASGEDNFTAAPVSPDASTSRGVGIFVFPSPLSVPLGYTAHSAAKAGDGGSNDGSGSSSSAPVSGSYGSGEPGGAVYASSFRDSRLSGSVVGAHCLTGFAAHSGMPVMPGMPQTGVIRANAAHGAAVPPKAESSESELVVDFAAALQNFGDDEIVFQTVLEAFQSEMQEQMDGLADAMAVRSFQQLRDVAHKFEGAATYLVATQIAEACGALKRACDVVLSALSTGSSEERRKEGEERVVAAYKRVTVAGPCTLRAVERYLSMVSDDV